MVSLYQPVNLSIFRHDRGGCPYAHNFQDFRRDPKKKYYTVKSFLFSRIHAPIGPRDKSSLSKIQVALFEWNALKVMDGLKRSITLTEKEESQDRVKLSKLNIINQSLPNQSKMYFCDKQGKLYPWSSLLA